MAIFMSYKLVLQFLNIHVNLKAHSGQLLLQPHLFTKLYIYLLSIHDTNLRKNIINLDNIILL